MIRQVLLSTNIGNLVDLCLNNRFRYPDSLSNQRRTSPPRHTSLPSLAFPKFYDANEYLVQSVSQVNYLPLRIVITVRSFNQIFFKIPHFCQSIALLDGVKF